MQADQQWSAGSALRDAQLRIAARPAPDQLAQHLNERYGLTVTGLTELDLGVYRLDHADGPAWVARMFPPIRPQAAAAATRRSCSFWQIAPMDRSASPRLILSQKLTAIPSS
jgi:hypothetical protein